MSCWCRTSWSENLSEDFGSSPKKVVGQSQVWAHLIRMHCPLIFLQDRKHKNGQAAPRRCQISPRRWEKLKIAFSVDIKEKCELCLGVSFLLCSPSLELRPAGCDPTGRRDEAAQYYKPSINWDQSLFR